MQTLAETARRYCSLVDQARARRDGSCVADIKALLPQLSDAVMALGGEEPDRPVVYHGGDLDERFEIFTDMRECLGDEDGYELDFTEEGEQRVLEGSLADDFTDIYFELKSGLDFLDEFPDDLDTAVQKWLDTFRLHWGQHLFDAMYALNRR